ncbi:MAG: deoxyribonuclease IV [Chitinophagales bacterium]|nr:deoxyribonuclease IV [Chitinophagales bacterium]
MLLGIHCSVAGGLENAFSEAARLNIDTFQLFTRNQRQWKARPVSKEEKRKFSFVWKQSKVKTIFSHCSYLLNPGSANQVILEKTLQALTEEVIRCTELKLSFCVMHPGTAGTQSKEEAMLKIAAGIKQVLQATHKSKVIIALENTAAQGSSVGGTFENLKFIYENVGSSRIGFCFDTCHAFAAGYDIRTQAGIEETLGSFDKICGLKNLNAFHLNDSKGELRSHLDRHEHIGKGKIGLVPFKYIMKNFPHIPKVIENKTEDGWDMKNLKTLRKMVK